jgi:hypothetical protein
MSNPLHPIVGDRVHYVSFGTPKGEYRSVCRAAIVTEVGQWVPVNTTTPESFDRSEGRPIQVVEQWWFDDAVALAVLNPTGMFFNGAGQVACKHSQDEHAGGTWHWPERP